MDETKRPGRYQGFDAGFLNRDRPLTLDDEMTVLVLCRYRLMSHHGEPVFGWKMIKTIGRRALMADFTKAMQADVNAGFMPKAYRADLVAYLPAPGATL